MADDTARVVYAWVLDGISTIFVTDEVLDTAWAVASSFVDTHVGLRYPDSLPHATNLRSLWYDDTDARFVVEDTDDSLAALFGANRYTATDLVTTLEAGVTAGPSLFSKHVGLESIGSAGDRRRFSCVPGFNVGMRHIGQNEAFANSIGTAPVSDGPVIWAGRRVCVYRIKLVAGVWQGLAAADLVWWGTMRGRGTQRAKIWTFACLGPESWAGGNLGVGNFEEGLRAVPAVELIENGQDGEASMWATLQVRRLDLIDLQHQYTLELTDTDNHLAGVTSYADVAAGVNAFLDDVKSSTQLGATTYDKFGNDLSFSTNPGTDGITLTWYRGESTGSGDPFIDNTDAGQFTAELVLSASEAVWRTLGYDVHVQNDNLPGDDEHYGQFSKSTYPAANWTGRFWAANPKATKAVQDFNTEGAQLTSQDWSSGGQARRWAPLYSGGAVNFTGEPGQELQLIAIDEIRMSGSKSRPLMADPNDNSAAYSLGGTVGDVTSQGIMVLEGPYRRRGDPDQADPAAGFAFDIERERREGRTVQVARVCWRDASGLVATDSDGWPRLVVYEWLDPRLYGFDYERFDGTWGAFRDPPPGAEPIRARPLTVWEYSEQGDKVTTVAQRILATTGTAGEWYEDAGLTTQLYGLGADESFLDLGDNDTGGSIPKDGEAANMGLGIPASMIQDPADFAALDVVVGQHLSRCKAAVFGIATSRQLLARLVAPTGLCWGYGGGKYGLFDPWKFPTPTDAALIITPELYGRRPSDAPLASLPAQELRLWSPIDRLEVKARIEPIDRDYERTVHRNSSDFGAAYRSQQILHRVDGDHLISERAQVVGNSWTNDIPIRWRQGFEFWGPRHSLINIPLHAEDAKDVWPQDGILITDPSLLDTAGLYGVSVAAGVVIGKKFNARDEVVTLKILIGAETEFRMYAPSAVATEYDETDPFVLTVEADHFGDRGGNSNDSDGFVEPSWSIEGGDADIEVFQFDGITWTGGIFGTVSSVTATTITLTGALTGATWISDHHSIVVLREFENQDAAWVKRWYAPITESDGTHDPASTAGSKWRNV